MHNTTEASEGDGLSEIKDLMWKLSGRVKNEVYVVDGKTGERRLICSYDFDKRDMVEIIFIADPKDLEGSPEEPGKERYTFCLNNRKPGEEVDSEMTGNKRQALSHQALEAFADDLRKADPTYEDYLHNIDIDFNDLSHIEKCKVLEHEMDLLWDMFDSYGSQPDEKPGLLKRLFS